MNIMQISLNNEIYQPLADITANNKMLYCEKHGYRFLNKTSGFTYNNNISGLGFEIIKMILDLFEEMPDLDWIHWTGCDTMVTNFNVRLEEIIDEEYHMIITVDGNGINADSFLIKNSRVGRGFMRWILDNVETYKNHYWYEQQAMIDFYFQAPLGKEIIKILPQRVMNSYLHDLYPHARGKYNVDKTGSDAEWVEGDFMLHLPALPIQTRIDVMKEYVNKVTL